MMGHSQAQLHPPSPVDWLPENPLVFFLLDLAAELDLESIHGYCLQKAPRGETAAWEDAAFRVLTGNQQLDNSRISDWENPTPRPDCFRKTLPFPTDEVSIGGKGGLSPVC